MSDKKNSSARVREILNGFVERVFENETEIELLAISTTDGVNITHLAAENQTLPAEKLADLSINILSLARELTRKALGEKPLVACFETESGCICVVRTTFSQYPCVLTAVAGQGATLAKTRLAATRLAEQISSFGRRD